MCQTRRLEHTNQAPSINQTAVWSQYFLPRFAFLKLTPELLHIDAMLGGFACADEYDGNVPAVTRFENCVVFDTHFMEHGAEFAQEWRDGRLRFFAKMASRTRVESHLARPRCGQAR